MRELLREMELFFIMEIVTQLMCMSKHTELFTKMVHFTVYKLYLNKSDLKSILKSRDILNSYLKEMERIVSIHLNYFQTQASLPSCFFTNMYKCCYSEGRVGFKYSLEFLVGQSLHLCLVYPI